jgi:hypothetical protein
MSLAGKYKNIENGDTFSYGGCQAGLTWACVPRVITRRLCEPLLDRAPGSLTPAKLPNTKTATKGFEPPAAPKYQQPGWNRLVRQRNRSRWPPTTEERTRSSRTGAPVFVI